MEIPGALIDRDELWAQLDARNRLALVGRLVDYQIDAQREAPQRAVEEERVWLIESRLTQSHEDARWDGLVASVDYSYDHGDLPAADVKAGPVGKRPIAEGSVDQYFRDPNIV